MHPCLFLFSHNIILNVTAEIQILAHVDPGGFSVTSVSCLPVSVIEPIHTRVTNAGNHTSTSGTKRKPHPQCKIFRGGNNV